LPASLRAGMTTAMKRELSDDIVCAIILRDDNCKFFALEEEATDD